MSVSSHFAVFRYPRERYNYYCRKTVLVKNITLKRVRDNNNMRAVNFYCAQIYYTRYK